LPVTCGSSDLAGVACDLRKLRPCRWCLWPAEAPTLQVVPVTYGSSDLAGGACDLRKLRPCRWCLRPAEAPALQMSQQTELFLQYYSSSKAWNIKSKNKTHNYHNYQLGGSAVFSIVWCSKCTIPNSLLKSDLHVFSKAGCSVWTKIFRQKLRVPPLVDPRAVEMNIFADLTISKRQKWIKEWVKKKGIKEEEKER
jgi:hypothetical protein